ncbi:carboxymuconolactone decarboxylase family protein [Rhodococcus sp. NPDC003322]
MTFHAHDLETAPAAARPVIKTIADNLGYLPAPVALMAESPELLRAFTRSNALFEKSTLTPLEREVVVLTIATRNECHVCVAMHSAALARSGTPTEMIAALRSGSALHEPRLEALRTFTVAVLDTGGAVSDAQTSAFASQGFTSRNALEVVLGVGTFTLSTFANRMTDAPLDAALIPFAWDGAA